MDLTKLEGFLVSYRLENTLSPHGYVTRGVCDEKNGFLDTVTERFKIGRKADGTVEYVDNDESYSLTGDELVSMNFWGFTPALFPVLEKRFEEFLSAQGKEMKSEYLIPAEIDALINSGKMKVRVLKTDATWFGVTFPEDKPAVRQTLADLIERGVYPSPLW